jgi:hypothetical protein
MIAQGNLAEADEKKEKLAREVDKQSLLALQALIQQRLKAFDEDEPVTEKETNGIVGDAEKAVDGEAQEDGDKDFEMSG